MGHSPFQTARNLQRAAFFHNAWREDPNGDASLIWRTKYQNYLSSETDTFNRKLDKYPDSDDDCGCSDAKKKDCEDALKSLGLLTHSWQDFYAHAVIHWTGQNGQTQVDKNIWTVGITGSPDQIGNIDPSSWDNIWHRGEHGAFEVSGSEGDLRKNAAIAFVKEKYDTMLDKWGKKCRDCCSKIGNPKADKSYSVIPGQGGE